MLLKIGGAKLKPGVSRYHVPLNVDNPPASSAVHFELELHSVEEFLTG